MCSMSTSHIDIVYVAVLLCRAHLLFLDTKRCIANAFELSRAKCIHTRYLIGWQNNTSSSAHSARSTTMTSELFFWLTAKKSCAWIDAMINKLLSSVNKNRGTVEPTRCINGQKRYAVCNTILFILILRTVGRIHLANTHTLTHENPI